MPAHRKLPPRRELRKLYLDQNMSLQQIADRYGVFDHRTVLRTIKRDAKRDGLTWPLKQGGAGSWARRKSEAIRAGRDEVKTLLVAAEIRESGLSHSELERRSGVSQTQISAIVKGEYEWMRRTNAEKIMAAIERHERSAA